MGHIERVQGAHHVSAPILLCTQIEMSGFSKMLLAEHKLVARAFQAADQAGARRVLLVSANPGDGKSHLAGCILRHAATVTDAQVRVQTLPALQDLGCDEDDAYLWVDGLTLLEEPGPRLLTPSVRASLHGALLIARGMATTRREIEECGQRLRALGLNPLGGIWNECDHPPASEALRGLRSSVSGWSRRLVPGALVRTARRSP